MLGKREPEIYGTQTLTNIRHICEQIGKAGGMEIDFRQSNHEGELVTWIQEAMDNVDGLIINPAAYTHTSIAIHDALKLLSCPIIEVHLSNPKDREDFRHHSYISPLASDIIAGKGGDGYGEALEILRERLND